MDIQQWSDSDYNEALELYGDPELPPETSKALGQKITLYETSKLSRGADQYRPTGTEVLEQNPDAKLRHDPLEQERQLQEQTRGNVRKFGGEQIASKFDALSQLGDADPVEKAVAQGAVDTASSTLPSATKDVTLYRPPEVMPKGADVLTAISAQRHFEPSLQEFIAQKGGELMQAGVDPAQLNESSPEYLRYTDEKWQTIHDQAEAEGRSVVRDAYKQDESWVRKADTMFDRGLDRARALGRGVVGGFMPGAEDAMSVNPEKFPMMSRLAPNDTTDANPAKAAAERHPIESGIGTLAGAMHPASLGSRVTGAVTKAVVPAAAGLGRKVLGSALGGAAGGTADALAGTGAQLARGEDVDANFEAKKAAAGLAIGGGLGAAGELAGAGFQALANRTRKGKLGEKIKLAEGAGYETSALRRMRPTPELQARINDAEARGVLHPAAELSEELTKKGSQVVRDKQLAARNEVESDTAGYYFATDNNPEAHRAPEELLNRTFGVLSSRHKEGVEVPFANTGPIVDQLPKLASATIVPKGEADEMLALSPGSFAMTVDELEALGVKRGHIEKMLSEDSAPPETIWGDFHDDPSPVLRRGEDGSLTKVGRKNPREEMTVVITGRKLSPKQFDETVHALDQAGGAIKGSSGKSDPAYDELMEAAHRDREQFPGHPTYAPEDRGFSRENARGEQEVVTGWAAHKVASDQKLRGAGDLAESAGFPRSMPAREAAPVGTKGGGGDPEKFFQADERLPAIQSFLNTERKVASELDREGFDAIKARYGEVRARSAQEATQKTQELLVDAEKAGVGHRGPVYRVMRLGDGELQKIQSEGIENKNIWSVSLSPEGARAATGKPGPGQKDVIFELEQNGSAIPVDNVPGSNTFEEGLVAAGKRWQVAGVRQGENGKTVVKLKESAAAQVGEKTLPKLSPKEWENVGNTVRALNSPDKIRSLAAWKEIANTGGFAKELDQLRGLNAGEELRYGSAGGPRAILGQGMSPSVFMSLGEGLKLRADPAVRTLASAPVSADLKQLLGMMRKGQTKESTKLTQQMFGLRGGQLGARGAAVANDDEKLTEEDMRNLQKLLEARQ